ncbi:uncharacterized protein LOC141917376 [Strix aluco]|uniref:uncharacterized protein LOC141917376 n=1 Tax=Strix aluco TaxID=111821 RepID=UPI003DA43C14
METPEATGATVPPEVSPNLLEPLVTVVAILGELGATPGDVPWPSQQARCGPGWSPSFSRSAGPWSTVRGRPPTSVVHWPPRGTTGATVATITRKWRESVASVEAAWATIAEDAMRLQDACGAVATTGATTGVSKGNLAVAVARETSACQDVLEAARALPVASEWAAMAEAVETHTTRVAEASEGAAGGHQSHRGDRGDNVGYDGGQGAGTAGGSGPRAPGTLGDRLPRGHPLLPSLRRRLEDIEATRHGGPEAPGVAQGGPGGPEDLLAAVTVAEALWDASARLARGHLLGTLQKVRGLLVTPNATVATVVAQRCREATAALPGLLPQGPR